MPRRCEFASNLNNFFSRVIFIARKVEDMDSRKRSLGVSPIIATLLLIAITVAAGIIVYVFVSGAIGNLTQGGGGQQTAQQIELTAYAFSPLSGACGGNGSLTGPCLTVTIKNAGGSSVTLDTIYFNGLPLTPLAYSSYHGGTFQPITLAIHQDETIQLAYIGTFSSYEGYIGMPSAVTGGSTNTLKFVSATGGLFSYTVTAGSSQ